MTIGAVGSPHFERSLNAGHPVEFDYEPAGQDSFRFAATRVRKL